MRAENVSPDRYTYSILLTSCTRSKAAHSAAELYHQIRADHIALDDYLRVGLLKLAASSASPNLSLCSRLFNGAERHTRIMCNVMMEAYACAGQLSDCLSIYRYMTSSNIAPDAYTVCALVKAQVRGGHADDALRVLEDVHKAGLSTPVRAFALVIDAYGKMGRLDRAVSVYDIMTTWCVTPTQAIYNILISACAYSGCIGRAMELYDEMRHTANLPGDRYTHHNLMKCYLHGVDGDGALRWYRAIKVSPFSCNQVSYRYALIAAGMIMDVNAVQEVVDDMRHLQAPLREDVIATLIAACVRCSDLHGASQYFQEYVSDSAEPFEATSFFRTARAALRLFEPISSETSASDFAFTERVILELEQSWLDSMSSSSEEAVTASQTGDV